MHRPGPGDGLNVFTSQATNTIHTIYIQYTQGVWRAGSAPPGARGRLKRVYLTGYKHNTYNIHTIYTGSMEGRGRTARGQGTA